MVQRHLRAANPAARPASGAQRETRAVMQAASTPSQSDAVAVERVTKRFGATLALDEASLHVRSGTVHALLGENGAGKSTLVKVLSGFVRPDAGTIALFG